MTEAKVLVGVKRGNLRLLRLLKKTDDSQGTSGSWEVEFPGERTLYHADLGTVSG